MKSIVNSKQSIDEIKHFTHLNAWKINHNVVLMIYKLTQSFPKEELYGITNQLRRAALSITSNIAEGWGHFHFANKTRFYYQARGSSCEVQNLLITVYDLKLINESEYSQLKQIVFEGYKLINGLIRSVEKTNNKN